MNSILYYGFRLFSFGRCYLDLFAKYLFVRLFIGIGIAIGIRIRIVIPRIIDYFRFFHRGTPSSHFGEHCNYPVKGNFTLVILFGAYRFTYAKHILSK